MPSRHRRTFQIVRPFPALSVEDNVIVAALLHRHVRRAARAHAHEVLRRLDLYDKRAQRASALTLPDRKRLEVARALATDPKLLLLDEVMAGLRPTETDRIVAVLKELNRDTGLTILLIEHVMRAVMALAGRVLVMHHGAAIAQGAPAEVVRDRAVIDSYLGAETVLMLKVDGLEVFYGDARALDGVSLEIEEGAIVAIVGANGAGKTSLIRTIAGMHQAGARRILYRGTDITGWPSHKVCDLGIGQVAEGRQVFPTFSVAENLAMGAMFPRARQSREQNLEKVYAMFPVLTERRHQAAGTLSGGEQQMLAIGRCLMGDPDMSCSMSPRSVWRRPSCRACCDRARSQPRRTHLRAGRAERRGVAEARQPRLCARERPHYPFGFRRTLLGDDRVRQAYLGL